MLGEAAGGLLDASTAHYVTRSLLWAAAILAVTVPLAVLHYRR